MDAPVAFDAVYVVNGESATISVINAETNQLAGTIALRGVAYPHHVSVSPDRSLLGVAVPGYDMSAGEFGHEHHSGRAGRVLLLEATSGKLRSSTVTNAANNNVTFTADGTQVLTSQATQPGSTLVLDVQSLAIATSISVGTSPAETALSRDGKLAYVANSGSSNVSVIDVTERRLRTTISVGAGPVLAQPSPDGFVFVENEPDHTVTVIDASTFSVVRTFELGFKPGSVAAPENEVWVTAPERGAVEIRRRTGELVRTVQTGRGAHWVVFSPDGKRAFISNEWEDTVSVIDRSAGTVIANIPVGTKPNGMVWRSR
jgi:YVTN family beta-propeller protein